MWFYSTKRKRDYYLLL